MKKVLLVQGDNTMAKAMADLEDAATLAKAHVKSYTRKDGTFVKEHDDGRQAAAPQMPSGNYNHPTVVGHADKHVGFKGDKLEDNVGKISHPTTHSIHFAGKQYLSTGKMGHSLHDKTPVSQFEHEESGERVWADDDGRVHSDSKDQVNDLRSRYEAHAGKSGGGEKKAEVTHDDLKKHKQYSADDHEYMKGKGYSPAEIKGIWDRDQAAGHEPAGHENNPYASKPKPVAKKPAKPKAPKAAAAPETKSNNEDWGFHGEAHHWSIRDKHGPDKSPYDLPHDEYEAHKANAAKKFSEAAHKLVQGGHFANHEQARDYLDSKHGRHLHDAAVSYSPKDHDIEKVSWLGMDVKRYKKNAGIK